jgi:hypothetical protein
VQSSAALRQVMYRLRKSLGLDLVHRPGNDYALDVASDAERFLETLDTRLWRGTYLEGVSLDVVSSVPEALYHALKRGIERCLESDPHEAARASRILVRGQPLDLEALHLTMRALRVVNAEDIDTVYSRSRAAFLQVGERLPRSWHQFSFDAKVAD